MTVQHGVNGKVETCKVASSSPGAQDFLAINAKDVMIVSRGALGSLSSRFSHQARCDTHEWPLRGNSVMESGRKRSTMTLKEAKHMMCNTRTKAQVQGIQECTSTTRMKYKTADDAREVHEIRFATHAKDARLMRNSACLMNLALL